MIVRLLYFIISLLLLTIPIQTIAEGKSESDRFYEIQAKTLDGRKISFSEYRGKVALIANISLMCGTTPQLHDLQELYEMYSSRGLVVLGFPSNDFTGKLEPTDSEKIHKTCTKDYGVTFPVFELGSVRGKKKQALFGLLTESGHDGITGEVHFNFEKFLIDRKGIVRHRLGPFTSAKSERMRTEIEQLLNEQGEGVS